MDGIVSERHAAFFFVGDVSRAAKVAGYRNRPVERRWERCRAVNGGKENGAQTGQRVSQGREEGSYGTYHTVRYRNPIRLVWAA